MDAVLIAVIVPVSLVVQEKSHQDLIPEVSNSAPSNQVYMVIEELSNQHSYVHYIASLILQVFILILALDTSGQITWHAFVLAIGNANILHLLVCKEIIIRSEKKMHDRAMSCLLISSSSMLQLSCIFWLYITFTFKNARCHENIRDP